MIEKSIWLSGKEASDFLRVEEHSLDFLRETGDLKPGPHWRSSSDPDQLPLKPMALYLISGCKEAIDCCTDNYNYRYQIAA